MKTGGRVCAMATFGNFDRCVVRMVLKLVTDGIIIGQSSSVILLLLVNILYNRLNSFKKY